MWARRLWLLSWGRGDSSKIASSNTAVDEVGEGRCVVRGGVGWELWSCLPSALRLPYAANWRRYDGTFPDQVTLHSSGYHPQPMNSFRRPRTYGNRKTPSCRSGCFRVNLFWSGVQLGFQSLGQSAYTEHLYRTHFSASALPFQLFKRGSLWGTNCKLRMKLSCFALPVTYENSALPVSQMTERLHRELRRIYGPCRPNQRLWHSGKTLFSDVRFVARNHCWMTCKLVWNVGDLRLIMWTRKSFCVTCVARTAPYRKVAITIHGEGEGVILDTSSLLEDAW